MKDGDSDIGNEDSIKKEDGSDKKQKAKKENAKLEKGRSRQDNGAIVL